MISATVFCGIPLCKDCHQGSQNGIHGRRAMWAGIRAVTMNSANATECNFLRDNPDWHWQFESTAFYIKVPDATGSCPVGTAPVYRLYNNGQGGAPNHRFTTDLATRNDFVARRGYVSEGTGPYGVSMCAAI